MKTFNEIQKTLQKFQEKYGIDAKNAGQRSEAWMTVKLGVPSASKADCIVAGTTTAKRQTYMASLVAQVATGIFPEINSKHLDWGNDHEDAARSSYEFATGNALTEVPFVFKDDTFRVGCSPDFLIGNKGGEIKCPSNSENFILFLCADKLKSEWEWQAQFQMYVTDAEEWDFAQYDPRMKKNPIKVHTLERDEEKQKTLADAVPQFIEDYDKMLAKAGFEFGEQWLRLKGFQMGAAV